jgi:outer membrane protein
MKPLVAAIVMTLASQSLMAEDLLEVYALAQANDKQLAAARASREAVLENRPIARSRLLPNINATGSANFLDINGDNNVVGNIDENYQEYDAGVTLRQTIFRRDQLMQLDQADSSIAQANAEFAAVEQELIFRAAQAYFAVLSALDTLEFQREDKKAIARQLDQAKQRFEVGLIAITGVHEAQARYDQAVADEVSAENDVGTAFEALREIVGPNAPSKLATLVPEIPLVLPDPNSLDDWSELAMQNNPSIEGARQAAEVARKEIEVQRSGHYPTLDLVGNYNYANSNSNRGSETDSWSASLQLGVPIYTGGGVTAATRQAQFNFQAAQEQLDSQRRAVDKQVRDAFRQAALSIQRVKSLKSAIVSSQSALEATEAGYEVGTRTLVDVLNRQAELFLNKRNYADARYAYILNFLALKQAAGTLSVDDLNAANAYLKE